MKTPVLTEPYLTTRHHRAVMVPLQIGFPEVQQGATVKAFAVFCDVMFFMDVIQNFLTSAFDERELLCEFSLSLRGEILHETYKNTFFRIPAFKRLSTQFVLDMAMFIKPLIVVNGDTLAREGCVGTEMFILNTGIIEVRRTPPENADWIVVLEVLTERALPISDDACVSYLMGVLDPEFCTPGEYVFKEGQVGRHMYFLVTGTAEVVFKAGTSEEQVVATLLEGGYFGEIAMLTRSKRAASIRAKTYMSLFVLSLHGLDRISTHYPEMAHSIIQEFRNKITHIKKTPVKQLDSLVQEDVKQARERSGLLAASPFSSSANGGGGTASELRATLGEFENILSHIVEIYGGGDRGKRKALGCVMQHLHKYEFSVDDFLQAAEELNYVPQMAATKPHNHPTGAVLNSLQMRMRRRSSFS
ncbi:hypothetical protein BBO99_00001854 [Phytophthora kernoviae]|uniref:Cyclic nucleotide-binding domain-containing protein n=2 Tax=Phytophthora kernoviae TaxID=325452 RepID=A0A421F974_9STRA|nr:hypothetical protein G195_001776 [Phytophthora kernoviae 00238/432]KAG2531058.1 hypothetical protein JM16_001347 [Phytophthora kernoviae]KAG2531617.1 hypothetical protein JM18_001634 [Phytophthora kernoviae]RLN31772.1 hypothetical protein BBI17_001612 [Phytophthora kernoviae]RLN83755.1 hypothetical protein BBO99_00001854 [Phytophthora kernoviae]